MRIVIADDDALLREGLVLLLAEAGFEVAAAVPDPGSFMRAVAEHEPDVAVVDARMPPTHTDEGVRAAVAARRLRPRLAVLVLSARVEESFAEELLASGAAGIGYLLKERVSQVREFVDALRKVAAGGTAIDPEVVSQLFTRRPDPLQALTVREREVLALMAEGLGNTAIAERMTVSPGAVHKHIRSIFAKLELTGAGKMDRRVTAVLRYLGSSPPLLSWRA
ncbi:response regulator transcription factor [Nonomuraea sp. NPDC055795]